MNAIKKIPGNFFALIFLTLFALTISSCHKDTIDQDLFISEFTGTLTTGSSTGFGEHVVIERDSTTQNGILLHNFLWYTASALLTSDTSFAIPVQLYATSSTSGGMGCFPCLLPGFLVKYYGYGTLDGDHLMIYVYEYRKHAGEADFSFFFKSTYNLYRQ